VNIIYPRLRPDEINKEFIEGAAKAKAGEYKQLTAYTQTTDKYLKSLVIFVDEEPEKSGFDIDDWELIYE
jgi:hypothetical protein